MKSDKAKMAEYQAQDDLRTLRTADEIRGDGKRFKAAQNDRRFLMEGVIEGRIVHFVLESGEHRPAIIVNAWHEAGGVNGTVNLQVFVDGTNDKDDGRKANPDVPPGASRYSRPTQGDVANGMMWRTSIHYQAEPLEGTWHWPEKT